MVGRRREEEIIAVGGVGVGGGHSSSGWPSPGSTYLPSSRPLRPGSGEDNLVNGLQWAKTNRPEMTSKDALFLAGADPAADTAGVRGVHVSG